MIREVVLRGTSVPNEERQLCSALGFLRSELGCDAIRARAETRLPELCVSLHDWSRDSVSVLGFDRMFDSARRQGPFRLALWSRNWDDGTHQALELLTRYQRLLPLPESVASMPKLAQVLAVHRLVHPLERPEVRASYEHALDVWRWLLRLNPAASPGLQMAALFHDVGLIESGSAACEGHTTRQTDDTLGSVRLACRALQPLALEVDDLTQMVALLAGDEQESPGQRQLLIDADGLSFLSLSAWHYLQDFGLERTRHKLRELLESMSDVGTCLALMTRQPRVIADLLAEVLDDQSTRDSGIRELGGLPWSQRALAGAPHVTLKVSSSFDSR